MIFSPIIQVSFSLQHLQAKACCNLFYPHCFHSLNSYSLKVLIVVVEAAGSKAVDIVSLLAL
jgi:hypothetical protein